MTEFMLSDPKYQKLSELTEWNLFAQFFPDTKASDNYLPPIAWCVEMPGRDAGGRVSQRRNRRGRAQG